MNVQRPLRILMTTDTVGGVWNYALELARGLSSRGHRIELAALGEPSDAQQSTAAAIEGVSLHHAPFRLEWMENPWADVDAAGEWLLALAADAKADLIHLNSYAHAALPWRVPVIVVAHSCVASWFEAVRRAPMPKAYDEYRRRVRAGVAHAQLVVAPTASMLAAFARHFGPLPRARVIANGRTLPAPLERRPKEPFIISIGRLWDEAKNVAVLDSVAKSLPWPVVVVGEPKHPEGARVSLSRVRALGPLPANATLEQLSRASIYVAPARYEPFGLAVLEAALCGCALVLGDIASLRETWQSAAAFVSPDDPADLERVLLQLIANEATRRRLAGRACARAQFFSTARMVDGTLDAYGEVLAREPRQQRQARGSSWAD